MKPFSGTKSPMMAIRLNLLLFLASAVSGDAHENKAFSSSVAQIRDTLNNLRRSVEDAKHSADLLFEHRQRWCDELCGIADNHQKTSEMELRHLVAELRERQAFFEEVDGTKQVLLKTMDSISNSINHTHPIGEVDADVDTLLSQAKQHTVALLEEQLRTVAPIVSNLQARMVQIEGRVADRNRSVLALSLFSASVRATCSLSLQRAEQQASARRGEANAVDVALQVLQKIDAGQQSSESAGRNSHVELKHPILQAILIQVRSAREQATRRSVARTFGQKETQHNKDKTFYVSKSRRGRSEEFPGTSMRPLVAGVAASTSEGGEPGEPRRLASGLWCSLQQLTKRSTLQFSRDSLAEVSAEVAELKEFEGTLVHDMQWAQSLLTRVVSTGQEFKDQAVAEVEHVNRTLKDQHLAVKILQQAENILQHLQTSGELRRQAADDVKDVANALRSAADAFEAHARILLSGKRLARHNLKNMTKQTHTLVQTLQYEKSNLELLLDAYITERAACVQRRRAIEDELQDTNSFLSILGHECRSKPEMFEEEQKGTQDRVLLDARRILSGHRVSELARPSRQPGLRGNPRKLSPMERAAAEMGVLS